jgi:hypothetical protein
MPIVLAVIAILPAAVILLGALSGRIRLTNCCSVADPSKDLRMRAAFDHPSVPQDGQSTADR